MFFAGGRELTTYLGTCASKLKPMLACCTVSPAVRDDLHRGIIKHQAMETAAAGTAGPKFKFKLDHERERVNDQTR